MRVVQASSGAWRTRREPGFDQNIAEAAREIIARVRSEGDAALFALTERFDGAKLSTLQVSEAETADALQQVGEEGLQLLRDAAHNIRMFHVKQLRPGFSFSPRDGVILGQTVEPLERVGLYVPGGTAAYPSTVLMNAIPAHIAGCPQLLSSPPRRAGTGASTPGCWRRRIWPASRRYIKQAARRPLPRWPTARRPSRAWTRSWARAMPMWPRPSGRYMGRWPST